MNQVLAGTGSYVNLTGAERDRYEAIQLRLSELSNDFRTHLVKEEQILFPLIRELSKIQDHPGPYSGPGMRCSGYAMPVEGTLAAFPRKSSTLYKTFRGPKIGVHLQLHRTSS